METNVINSKMDCERLKRNLSILEVLVKTTKWQREDLIATANRDQLMCICDCAFDVLYKKVHLTDEENKALKRYNIDLIHLIRYKNYRIDPERRQFINERSKLLPLLIEPIIRSYFPDRYEQLLEN